MHTATRLRALLLGAVLACAGVLPVVALILDAIAASLSPLATLTYHVLEPCVTCRVSAAAAPPSVAAVVMVALLVMNY